MHLHLRRKRKGSRITEPAGSRLQPVTRDLRVRGDISTSLHPMRFVTTDGALVHGQHADSPLKSSGHTKGHTPF